MKVPSGLKAYLEKDSKNDCKEYMGTGSPTGVALFAVKKSVEGKYAEMVYGCSDNLINGTTILAVYHNGAWKLLQPTHTYATDKANGEYRCKVLNEYDLHDVLPGPCETEVQTKQAVNEINSFAEMNR